MNHAIRILLADDHPVVRAGYRRLLEQIDDFEIVAEAADGEAAYLALQTQPVDVAILDISMPGIGGIELLRRIRARKDSVRVLIFSVHDNPGVAQRALDAGADGYLCKTGAADEMIDAVRTVAGGARYLSPPVGRANAAHASAGASDTVPFDKLSPREFEILRLFGSGLRAEEVADVLKLSAKTVSNRLTVIKQKFGARSHSDLMRRLVTSRLLDDDRR